MQFDGDMTFTQKPEDVWAKLSDVRFLIQCIPDAEEISEADEQRGVCRVRPGFSFVRGSLELTIERTQAEAPQHLQFHMHSKGVGSSSEVVSRLTLAAPDGGTQVHWQAEVQKLGGLLKAVPKGLIRGAAQKIIGDVWERVAANIQSDDGAR